MQERRTEALVQTVATGGVLGVADAGCGGLKSLAGESVADRYCAWRGASERRYVTSIFPVDPAAADGGLPAFDGFVLVAVARSGLVRNGSARRILFSRAVERASEARCAVARGLAEGADEWHVHFLADRPSARAAVVADLCRRHLSPGSPPLLRLAS